MSKKKLFGIFLATLIFITISVIVCLPGCVQRKEYSVSYIATDGGYISGEVSQIVSENGSTQPVAVNLLDGYYFDGWSDGDGHFVRSDKNVTADITVTAIFKRRTFSVQYVAGSYGTIRGESSQTVNMYDDSTEVTAIPNEGYKFVGWSDGVTETTRFEEKVEKDVSVTANFEIKTYSVKFAAGSGGAIEGETEQTVKHGYNHGEITAIPDWGYVFVGWSDSVKSATRSDTVKTDIDVTAYFERGFEGGDGSVRNPFTISTYKQFCNIVFYPTEYFKLINDLDLKGINHRPLFEEDKPTAVGAQPFHLNRSGKSESFSGEFDGCGHSIKNLTVDCDSEYPSLFGVLGGGGYVKNLNVVNASIMTTDFDTSEGKYYVGILAGVLSAFAQNVTVSGEIIIDGLSHDGVAVGGIAGQAFYPMIDCLSNVNITAHNIVSNKTGMTNPFCLGGLAGVCSSWSIAGCEAKGTIIINNSNALNPNVIDILTGGLIGYCFGDLKNSGDDIDAEDSGIRIVDSHSIVDIIENKSDIKASGFISVFNIYKFEISDCSSKGDVQSKMAAGFFHSVYVQTESVMENCCSEGNLVAKTRACGVVCGANIKNVNFFRCFVGGEITAEGYASGFIYNSIGAVTVKDCIVISNLTGNYASGFAYYSVKNTIFERCGFEGSIQCVKGGAGICYSINGSKILNCYSVGNVSVNNVNTTDKIIVGGLCAQISSAQIENCYFAGTVYVEAEYSSNSYVGLFTGLVNNSVNLNCHVLISKDSEIKNIIGGFIGDADMNDIITYEGKEAMYEIADALNAGQGENVWQNVPNDLPKLVIKSNEKIQENN